MLGFALTFILVSLLGCTISHATLNDSVIYGGIIQEETYCTGDIGSVNPFIQVTDTEMIITYDPPVGFENCDMDYEVTFFNDINLAVYQRTLNKDLRQAYNYWEGRVLCKLVYFDAVPIYKGVRGKKSTSNQFTDKFRPHIDIGPPRYVTLRITDVLHIRWVSPVDYDTCPIHFRIETRTLDGELLNEDYFQGYEWKYDYASDNNYCKHVVVIVESFMSPAVEALRLLLFN